MYLFIPRSPIDYVASYMLAWIEIMLWQHTDDPTVSQAICLRGLKFF